MRLHQIQESPIYDNPHDTDPNNPIVKKDKANPMELKSRIVQARNQLKELAKMAESDDLVTWQRITQLALGGGWTMGLVQNLEEVQHGIEELSNKRKKGGIQSRGIDKNI